MRPVYDSIGTTYARFRMADPRIAAQIGRALGDASPVLNVGAGTGSYEHVSHEVVAVEPSAVMIGQRRPGSAPVVQAVAEHLPFPDQVFGGATAVLTVHHWSDPAAGLAEVCRVTTGTIVVLTWETALMRTLWMYDYLPPGGESEEWGTVAHVLDLLPDATLEPVLVPHDCTDGFFPAYWRRPERYLDRDTQAAISGLARLSEPDRQRMERRLRGDLDSRRWHDEHADLLAEDSHDYGLRLVIARRGAAV